MGRWGSGAEEEERRWRGLVFEEPRVWLAEFTPPAQLTGATKEMMQPWPTPPHMSSLLSGRHSSPVHSKQQCKTAHPTYGTAHPTYVL